MPYNKVVYGGRTLIDLTKDTVTSETMLKGYTAHKADGSIITGTFEGGSKDEEIERILTSGLTDGYKYYLDEGNLICNSQNGEYKLTKTISPDNTKVTTVLTDLQGNELGRTVKVYSNRFQTITTTDHWGRTLTKNISKDARNISIIFKDANGKLLGESYKVFDEAGNLISSTINIP